MGGTNRLAAIVTHLNLRLLQQTFETVKSRADVLAKRFYERLFAEHPRLKPLFGHVNLDEQHQKLIQSLVLVVKWLETPDRLTRYVHELGGRHADYHVGPQDYEPFVETFIAVLGETVGAIWTTECEAAWRQALRAVTDTMLEGSGVFEYRAHAMLASANARRPASVNGGSQQEVTSVKGPATPTRTSAMTMVATSEETARQAEVVAATDQQVTRNFETVFSSAAQLSASIDEIGRCVQDASKMTAQANHEADNAKTTIQQLREVSAQIGQVIKVIASIAEQSSFLALNATIEAAHAGEAGKGFAAVANEVKELARLTAKATGEIGPKIESIQNSSGVALSAIGSIGGIINRINGIAATIAEAMDVQTAATSNISRNVAEAARGTADVIDNIADVSLAVDATGNGSIEILVAAEGLRQESGPARRRDSGVRAATSRRF